MKNESYLTQTHLKMSVQHSWQKPIYILRRWCFLFGGVAKK